MFKLWRVLVHECPEFNIVKFIIELKFAPRSRGGATIATIATIAGIASIADTSHETRDTNWSSGPQLSLVVAAVSLEVTAVWVGATTLCNFSALVPQVFALCKQVGLHADVSLSICCVIESL